MKKALLFILIILVLGEAAFYLATQKRAGPEMGVEMRETREDIRTQGHVWERKADMPTPRMKVAVVALLGKIYAIGGHDGANDALAAVEVYDPKENSWSKAPDLPEPRFASAAVSLNNKLYVIGGFAGTRPLEPKADVFEFDPAVQQWTRKASLPTPRGTLAAAVINSKIFAVGGIVPDRKNGDVPLQPISDIIKFDGLAVTGELTVYNPLLDRWEVKKSSPTKRHTLAVTAINGLLYAVGGRQQILSRSFATLETYNPKTDTWSSEPPIPAARSNVAGTTLGNLFIVIGGLKQPQPEDPAKIFDEVDVFDPEEKRWVSWPKLSFPRHGLGATVLDNKIYAIGGNTVEYLGNSSVDFNSGTTEVFQLE